MAEALALQPFLGPAPELDLAELRRRASEVEAVLRLACQVPVPESDVDQDSVRSDAADEATAGLEDEAGQQGRGRLTLLGDQVRSLVGMLQPEQAITREQAEAAQSVAEGMSASLAELREAQADEENPDPCVAVLGQWVCDKGDCSLFQDHRTNRLTYEEPLGNGSRLHGFLTKLNGFREEGVAMAWEADLSILDEDEDPWYGPSCGEQPESVGDIQVRYRVGSRLETRIRVDGEDDDWQPPQDWRRQRLSSIPAVDSAEDVFVFGA
uniref:Uncharacterized protein n=1 Tax=Alexandrium catenella TaxID=2925 RepID=A0A7S1M5M7_ALECA